MEKLPPNNVWHLDADSRVTPQADGRAWRVVAADRERGNTVAEYLFCAPDFLFPVDSIARALRLEIDPRPPAALKSRRVARRRRAS